MKKRYLAYLLLIVIPITLPCQVNAAKIYKWKDVDGKIHYSATPPVHQESKSMGSTNNNRTDAQSNDVVLSVRCKKAKKSELIVGDWILKKNKKIRFRFYDHWLFNQASGNPIQKYFIDIGQGNSQSGKWSVSGSSLNLIVRKIGKKNEEFKTITKALIHKVDNRELYLLINNTEPMKFKRYTGSGNKPKCMTRKKRK